MPTKGAGADWIAYNEATADSDAPGGVGIPCLKASRRDLAIRCGEKFYPDRGMREVDPLTDMPRANLASVQQLVQLGCQPANTEDTAHHRKCDHAFIRTRHH